MNNYNPNGYYKPNNDNDQGYSSFNSGFNSQPPNNYNMNMNWNQNSNYNYPNSNFNTSSSFTNQAPINPYNNNGFYPNNNMNMNYNYNNMGTSLPSYNNFPSNNYNYQPYPLNTMGSNINYNANPIVPSNMGTPIIPSYLVQSKFIGISGCYKCAGTGWKFSLKKMKTKPCKACMISKGFCAYCGNTGLKYKNGKLCKCKRRDNCLIF